METVDDEYGADLWIDCEKREVLIISSKDKEIAENSMTHILHIKEGTTIEEICNCAFCNGMRNSYTECYKFDRREMEYCAALKVKDMILDMTADIIIKYGGK